MKTNQLLKIAAGILLTVFSLSTKKINASTTVNIGYFKNTNINAGCSGSSASYPYVGGTATGYNTGDSITLYFDFGDGNNYQTKSALYTDSVGLNEFYGGKQHTYNTVGSYTVTVTATGPDGTSKSTTLGVDVYGNCSTLNGKVYLDKDNTCTFTTGDSLISLMEIYWGDANGNTGYVYSDVNGDYSISVPSNISYYLAADFQYTGFTSVCAGTYTVGVSSAGTYSNDFSLQYDTTGAGGGCNNFYLFAANTTPASCNSCTDGIATAYAYGGTGNYTYLWSSGDITQTAYNLSPGLYSVDVTDVNGCIASDYVMVTDTTGTSGSGCKASFYVMPDSTNSKLFWIINNSTTSSSNGYCGWSWGDGTYDLGCSPTHTYTASGTYNVCLLVADSTANCADTMCTTLAVFKSGSNFPLEIKVIPAAALGVKEITKEKSNLNVYPNPANQIVNLSFEKEFHGVLSVIDMMGKEIVRQTINGMNSKIDLSNVQDGLYTIRSVSGSEVQTKNMMIVH